MIKRKYNKQKNDCTNNSGIREATPDTDREINNFCKREDPKKHALHYTHTAKHVYISISFPLENPIISILKALMR